MVLMIFKLLKIVSNESELQSSHDRQRELQLSPAVSNPGISNSPLILELIFLSLLDLYGFLGGPTASSNTVRDFEFHAYSTYGLDYTLLFRNLIKNLRCMVDFKCCQSTLLELSLFIVHNSNCTICWSGKQFYLQTKTSGGKDCL